MRTFALLVAAALLVGAAAQEVYNVRACTASPGEQEFCENALELMNAAGEGRINFSCVEFGSSDECLEAIARGDADWRTSDSGDIFYAWEELGLRAIVSENYGKSGVAGGEYYAVAVVRAEMCEDESVTLGSLRGMRSCHTGYRKTAGWRMPLGMLMANDHITPFNNDDNIENDAEMVADFFATSCAPRTSGNGPINTEDGAGALWDELCSGCINPNVTEEDRCTTRDVYYNYPGALRCLMEDSGDVAFIKHTTVPDFAADGATPAEWATLSSDDLRIMCVSGGCAPIANWSDCNLARVPAHAVVANPLSPFVEDGTLADVLVDLSMTPEFQAIAFNGTTNEEDYLFKSSTQFLDAIEGDTGSYLGAAALAFEFLETVASA